MPDLQPRVRFAPSPTGPLHIGGVRTALYNYLFARKHRGTFVLRVEDTDQKRYVEGAEEYIQAALAWCGIDPSEGTQRGGRYAPYRQSERSGRYAEAAQQLLDAGLAYYAFDSPETLEEARHEAEAGGDTFRYDANTRERFDNALTIHHTELAERLATDERRVVRLRVDPGEEVIFTDRVRGSVRFSTDELDDKVLLKADGLPTYHLANVVDDHDMAITHVIRGEEWLPSTGHHVLLYEAFGWRDQMPEFAHLPLILKPTGKGKLSKRDGAKFGIPVFPIHWHDPASGEDFTGFRESGFLSSAVVNFLAFLGWNPGTERELFSLDELVEAFSLDQIGKSGARFDYDKARWFNQQHLQRLPVPELARLARAPVDAAGYEVDDERLERIAALMQNRIHTVDDVVQEGRYCFEAPTGYDDAQAGKRLDKLPPEALAGLTDRLRENPGWTAPNLSMLIKSWASEAGVKPGLLFPLFRIALTGGMSGPDVFELCDVLGKDETLERWDSALAHFTQLSDKLTGA